MLRRLKTGGKAARLKSELTAKTAEANKKKKAANERQAALRRQREVDQSEGRQTWHFVYGIHDLADRSVELDIEIYPITGVTPRNLWMESEFIFSQIRLTMPGESFHPADTYCLAWTAPLSRYMCRIPLTSIEQQEEVYYKIAAMHPRARRKLIFCFFPLHSSTPMFAPPIHPAILVSFRTKTEVFNKLCDLYVTGNIQLDELSSILANGIHLWRKVVYRNLPADWRAHHEYLNVALVKPSKVDADNVASHYLDGNVPLNVFTDLTYAERARKRAVEALPYPRPYEAVPCLVCAAPQGIIKCKDCENKLCTACVERMFNDDDDEGRAEAGSFLAVHRYYCMKRTRLARFCVPVAPAPAYLLELRVSSRQVAAARLPPELDFDDDEEMIEISSDGNSAQSEDASEAIVAEAAVAAPADIPSPFLDNLDTWAQKKTGKLSRLRRRIERFASRLEGKSRTSVYYLRELASLERHAARLPKHTRYCEILMRKLAGASESDRRTSKWKDVMLAASKLTVRIGELDALCKRFVSHEASVMETDESGLIQPPASLTPKSSKSAKSNARSEKEVGA